MWGGQNSVRDRDQGWNAFESVTAVIWENLHLRSEGAAERLEIQEQRLLGKPEKSKSEAEPGSSAGRLLSDKDAAGAGGCRGRG